MTDFVIETDRLRKTFGSKVAVADLTLRVRAGEVFGFLGPNGAGKTTSMKMLLGLVHPTSGNGVVLGRPVGNLDARREIGFLPEHFRFHDWMTGREFLAFHGQLHGIQRRELDNRIDELLDRVDLADAAGRKLREYSKGMQQRIGLAQALLNRPRLIFLDEPTSGLDPIGRILVRDIVLKLREEGVTVFFNSHILTDIEAICDRVVFLRRGRIIQESRLADRNRIELELRLGAVDDGILQLLQPFGTIARRDGTTLILDIPDENCVPEITRRLVENNVNVYRVAAVKRSLESEFIEVMGGDERAG